MSACATCGGPLAPNKAPGRPRKFCSERCRRAQYAGTCIECGAPTSGSDGPGNAPEVCAACSAQHYAIWTPEAIILAMQEWADEHGGIPPSATQWQAARAAGDSNVTAPTNVIKRFGTWSAAIRAAGLEPHVAGAPVGGGHLTPMQRQECASRYAAGESSTVIAADFGCSPLTVLKWARAAGVPIRPSAFDRGAA